MLGVLRDRLDPDARDPRAAATARRSTSTASASRSIRPGTSSARPRSGSSIAARSGSSRATTRPSPTRPARRSSRSAATPSSPSRPSACRSTAGRAQAEVLDGDQRLVAGQPGGRQGQPALRLRPRQGAAAARRARPEHRPDLHSRRGGAAQRESTARPASPCRRRPTSRHGRTARPTGPRAIVLAPPSADGSPWARRFGPHADRRSPRAGCRSAAPGGGARRPRLRPLRPRRLAQPARRHRGHRGGTGLGDARLHRSGRPLARGSTGSDAHGGRRPGSRANGRSASTRSRGAAVKASPTSTPRSTRRPPPARRSPPWRSTSRPRPPADAAWAVHFLIGRRPKRLVSRRQAPGAGRRKRPGSRTGSSRSATHAVGDLAETIALLLPDAGDVERRPLPTGSRSGCSAAGTGRGRAAQRDGAGLARARPPRALRLEQAASPAAFASACRRSWSCGPWRRRAAWTEGVDRAPAHGRLGADAGVLPAAARARYPRRRRQPARIRSSWPIRWRRRRRRSARSRRLAGGMEVGRHPRAAHPARRADVPLVARRGAGHRTVSRDRGGRRRCCPRAPSSTARCCPGTDGAPLPVRADAAADRPQDPRQEDPRARCRWSWSPTTCWRARRGSAVRCRSAERRRRLAALLAACRPAGRLALSPAVDAPRWEAVAQARLDARASGCRGADAQAARRARTASAGAGATGGSGRSSRSPSTPC